MPYLLPAILISGALCGVCTGLLLYSIITQGIPHFGARRRMKKILGKTRYSRNQRQKTESSHHLSFLKKLGLELAPSSPRELEKAGKKLVVAGFRQKKHLFYYYLLKYSCLTVAAAVGLLLWLTGSFSAVLAIVFPILFLLLPDVILTRITRKRLQEITMALPDFIDMCNINMTAGLGWLNSVKKVTGELEDIHPVLCREFTYLLDQTQAGMDRMEAYNRLFDRNPTPEMQSLVTAMIQNERMGSSITNSLAALSKRIYDMREQSVEMKAGKLPAKMTFITLIFIFIPYFLILLGEHVVKAMRMFESLSLG